MCEKISTKSLTLAKVTLHVYVYWISKYLRTHFIRKLFFLFDIRFLIFLEDEFGQKRTVRISNPAPSFFKDLILSHRSFHENKMSLKVKTLSKAHKTKDHKVFFQILIYGISAITTYFMVRKTKIFRGCNNKFWF